MRNKRIFFRLAALLLAAALAAVCILPACADEWIDFNQKGSISLTLQDKEKNQPVSGGEITLYQVASVAENDGDLSFAYTNGFENCGIALGDLSDSKLPAQLEEKLSASAAKTSRTVGADGTVTFTDLPLGLYLLVQTKAADSYNSVSSFLVSVPMQEDGVYLYAVDATPKVEKVTPKPETPKTPTTPSVLPKTGQLDWPIPVLSAAGLLLFALGWSLRKGKRQAKT